MGNRALMCADAWADTLQRARVRGSEERRVPTYESH
jgi:hypothetical protein